MSSLPTTLYYMELDIAESDPVWCIVTNAIEDMQVFTRMVADEGPGGGNPIFAFIGSNWDLQTVGEKLGYGELIAEGVVKIEPYSQVSGQ